MPLPFHPPLFDHFNNIWRGVQIVKLFNKQFSPSSCNFLPLTYKYSSQTLSTYLLVRRQNINTTRRFTVMMTIVTIVWWILPSLTPWSRYLFGLCGQEIHQHLRKQAFTIMSTTNYWAVFRISQIYSKTSYPICSTTTLILLSSVSY
jgi:hypothetical protein